MKKYFLLLALFLFLLIALNKVNAFSVEPNNLKIYFEPNLNKNYTVHIYAANVVANVNGPLASDILVYKQSNNLYLINIKLPQELQQGYYNNEVLFYELPTKDSIGELNKQILNITVVVPTKKQLEYSINITKNKDDELIFDISLTNIGSEAIQNAKAIISIYQNSKKIDELQTDAISLKPRQKDNLVLIWNMQVNGVYSIKGVIDYDSALIDFYKDFNTNFLEYNQSYGFKYNKITIIIVFLLMALNIAWIFYFKQRLKNKQ